MIRWFVCKCTGCQLNVMSFKYLQNQYHACSSTIARELFDKHYVADTEVPLGPLNKLTFYNDSRIMSKIYMYIW